MKCRMKLKTSNNVSELNIPRQVNDVIHELSPYQFLMEFTNV